VLIVSNEESIGEALSGLPLVYHLVATETQKGPPLYALFRNREVFGLIPHRVRSRISLIGHLDQLFELEPRLVEQRIVHLATEPCRIRYGHRYHTMHAHFINHGIYPDQWEPPVLEYAASRDVPIFDILISPYYHGHDDAERVWPYERWQELIDRLAGRSRVGILSMQHDPRPLRNAQYFTCERLADVCALMAKVSGAVISIENDWNHLAHDRVLGHAVRVR
jgi:hypothetical protein